MQSLLDSLAWYLTALLCGFVLLPVIYGFATADDWLVAGPVLGLCLLSWRSISILRAEVDPSSTIARWALIAVLLLLL